MGDGLSPNLHIPVPADALVVLIGAAGSGKSTFATREFPGQAIVSSDQLRNELAAADSRWRRRDVFEQLRERVETRLAAGNLTVVDATNTDWMRRAELVRMARRHGRAPLAIVFNLPSDVTLATNPARPGAVPASTVRRQVSAITRDIDRLDLEGFTTIVVFRSLDEAGRADVEITGGPVSRASPP
ncbi:MAG TPA: AAA family ATPase [Candidatus Acidoferrum sp.]|nr:AAA family ATPase [Candidatus Acidoferrum sp.]